MATPSPQEDRRDPPHVAAQRAATKAFWDQTASWGHDINQKAGLFRGAIAKTLGMSEDEVERQTRPFPGSVSSVKVSNVNWPLAGVLSTGLLGGTVLGYQALKPDTIPVQTQSPSPVSQPLDPGGNQNPTGQPPVIPSPTTPSNPPAPQPNPNPDNGDQDPGDDGKDKGDGGATQQPKYELPPPVSWDWRIRWWTEDDGKVNSNIETLPSKPGRQPDEPPDDPPPKPTKPILLPPEKPATKAPSELRTSPRLQTDYPSSKTNEAPQIIWSNPDA